VWHPTFFASRCRGDGYFLALPAPGAEMRLGGGCTQKGKHGNPEVVLGVIKHAGFNVAFYIAMGHQEQDQNSEFVG